MNFNREIFLFLQFENRYTVTYIYNNRSKDYSVNIFVYRLVLNMLYISSSSF